MLSNLYNNCADCRAYIRAAYNAERDKEILKIAVIINKVRFNAHER